MARRSVARRVARKKGPVAQEVCSQTSALADLDPATLLGPEPRGHAGRFGLLAQSLVVLHQAVYALLDFLVDVLAQLGQRATGQSTFPSPSGAS